MSRTIPAGLATELAKASAALVMLVKLERTDGTKYGYTSDTEDTTYSGLDYKALDGLDASNLKVEAGTGVDGADVVAILNDALSRVVRADLDAGLYQNATVTVYMGVRGDIASGVATLGKYFVGVVTTEDASFKLELRGLSQMLKQTVGEACQWLCPARLGDNRCKVTLASYQVSKSVDLVTDSFTLRFAATAAASGYYEHGTVAFTTGDNAGISRPVKVHTLSGGKAVITLHVPFPYTVVAGDTATLTAGCDKLITTCRSKFSNANNFRGFYQLPGQDTALQPGNSVT